MKAKCLWCSDILESKDGAPDSCKCGRSFLDVGPDHYRAGGSLIYVRNDEDNQ